MEDEPRFRFFSFTFIIGFGVGTFVGVALGLMAFLFVDTGPESQAGAGDEPTPVFTTAPVATPVRVRTNTAMEVRIGPGTQYAAVGTIARGESIDIIGRDDKAEWLAVRFPPGSSSRGWIPVTAVENLTGLYGLSIVSPTPLPRTVSTPLGSIQGGIAGTTTADDGDPDGTPAPGTTPAATRTATPQGGLPDLVVASATLLGDGRVHIVIANRGSGDLAGFQVYAIVTDPTTRSEQLRSPGAGLRAGESVTLETSTFTVNVPTQVTVIVDPSVSTPDTNRGNNILSVTLTPAASPTATPNP